MMQSHLFGLSFLLFLSITEFARSKSFTAHLDPSLSRRPRDVQNDVLTPLSLHVASKITSRFANTLVTSTLENRSLKSREAKFVVLLPETAFISNFSMVVNETHYIGKVKEKQVAETEYHNAKQEDIIAGLVSLILSASQLPIRGMDNFEIKINMAPKSRAEFYLSYQQLLVRRNGYYEQVISIRPKQIVPELKVVVDIEEPQALRYVDVMKIRQYPSDALAKGNPLATVTYTSPTLVHIEYNPSENDQKKQGLAGVDGDFIVRYDVQRGNDAGVIQVLGSHFVQYFSPTGLNPLPKNVVFVIDISGSMSGEKIEQTRQAMSTILSQLRAGDAFNIILFNEDTVQWKDFALPATSDNVKTGKTFVDQHAQARGLTNINDALLLALEILRNTSNQRDSPVAGNFPVVLFLTDGLPTDGEADTKLIRSNVLKANTLKASIFALGFGSIYTLDLSFLTALSVENGGTSRRIYPDEDATRQLEGFYDEISTPLLLHVRFKYPKDIVDDTRVTALSFAQYFDGSELVVSGKLNEGQTSRLMFVDVRGISNSSNLVTYNLSRTLNDLTVPSAKTFNEDFIERLWAYMKIKQLLIEMLITDNFTEKRRLRTEALEMSLKYNFVTPLTSFVVVQSDQGKVPPTGLAVIFLSFFFVRFCFY